MESLPLRFWNSRIPVVGIGYPTVHWFVLGSLQELNPILYSVYCIFLDQLYVFVCWTVQWINHHWFLSPGLTQFSSWENLVNIHRDSKPLISHNLTLPTSSSRNNCSNSGFPFVSSPLTCIECRSSFTPAQDLSSIALFSFAS